jgi:hypothetical protein
MSMAAVASPSPHPRHRGHDGPRGRVRADQADVPLDEHIPMLLEVPGWRPIRRFRLVRATSSPGPEFLSVHELAGSEAREEPGYQTAIGA